MKHVPLQPGTVKICGLREPEHAIAAAEGGADLIGFIFAPTRRYVPPEAARRAIEAAKGVSTDDLIAVGVFVNTPAAEINGIADEAGLDIIQLSGDEEPGDAVGITRPVIKALRPPAGATVADLSAVIDRWNQEIPAVTFLIDGFHPGHFGGSGVRADWHLAAEIAARRPIMLAGGIAPGNVAEAISAVAPLGVDVSSGVEVDGRKDGTLIRAFIRSAKAAFNLQSKGS
jgi:phosphoribosylanthranilate isomerase